jgi:hypothetical protein
MKKPFLIFIVLLLSVAVQAQQRDRLAELDVVCRNEMVTHTSVAPDGTLWMATQCGDFSIDTAGHMESYIYPQPLAAFVQPGLRSMEIMTYTTLGHGVFKETISFHRKGESLVENAHT